MACSTGTGAGTACRDARAPSCAAPSGWWSAWRAQGSCTTHPSCSRRCWHAPTTWACYPRSSIRGAARHWASFPRGSPIWPTSTRPPLSRRLAAACEDGRSRLTPPLAGRRVGVARPHTDRVIMSGLGIAAKPFRRTTAPERALPRWWRAVRRGRMQRTLALSTALSALPLGIEIYFEHFRGSFGDKWMWTPVVLSPALSAAGVAAVRSEKAARTWLPALSALYCLDGVVGVITHVRGVARKPGGFREPMFNIVMGPPLLAPGSLALVGGMGMAAAAFGRER